MYKNLNNLYRSITLLFGLVIVLILFSNSANFFKAENAALKKELISANNKIVKLEMQLLKGNADSRSLEIDSTTFKRDFITVEEAKLYKENYKRYINSEGTEEGNKIYFDINIKLNTALTRSRDLAPAQTGCRIYYGLKNPEASKTKYDFVQIIYPIDEEGTVLEFGPKVAFVPIVSLPRQEFLNARKLLNCPPYCD